MNWEGSSTASHSMVRMPDTRPSVWLVSMCCSACPNSWNRVSTSRKVIRLGLDPTGGVWLHTWHTNRTKRLLGSVASECHVTHSPRPVHNCGWKPAPLGVVLDDCLPWRAHDRTHAFLKYPSRKCCATRSLPIVCPEHADDCMHPTIPHVSPMTLPKHHSGDEFWSIV
jgi:hypothetical protein